jgi:hypothetical protein
LLRYALESFGYELAIRKRRAEQRNPVLGVSRCRNGFFLSSYAPNLNTELKLRFPQGAPLLIGTETELEAGHACYHLPRAWHKECRVFIEQVAGEVFCVEPHSGEIDVTRRLQLTGLKDATVRFYPETGVGDKVTFLASPVYPFQTGNFLKAEKRDDYLGKYYQVTSVSAPLLISW